MAVPSYPVSRSSQNPGVTDPDPTARDVTGINATAAKMEMQGERLPEAKPKMPGH